MLKVLDLFSGIGGFSLGLERTGGFKTVAFCEIEPFCQCVLKKHWPEVPVYGDIRELTAARLRADRIVPDVLCGGFPCQDVSLAGNRGGIEAERSGLWSEYARLVDEIRPRFVIVENTPGLLSLGMGRVLGDLAAMRYDAEWFCIPAAALGADHLRERIWIIAYPDETWRLADIVSGRLSCESQMGTVASDADIAGELQSQGIVTDKWRRAGDGVKDASADTMREGLSGRGDTRENGTHAPRFGEGLRLAIGATPTFPRDHWAYQPLLGRGIHGISDRVDRIESLGNCVVPQIPEMIGRAILATIVPGNAP